MEIIDWIMRFIIHVDTGSSDQLGDSLQALEELFGIGEGLNGTVQLAFLTTFLRSSFRIPALGPTRAW